jgi:hypothetical protein
MRFPQVFSVIPFLGREPLLHFLDRGGEGVGSLQKTREPPCAREHVSRDTQWLGTFDDFDAWPSHVASYILKAQGSRTENLSSWFGMV